MFKNFCVFIFIVLYMNNWNSCYLTILLNEIFPENIFPRLSVSNLSSINAPYYMIRKNETKN